MSASAAPRLSVVVPVKNEAGNVAPLVAEIEAACRPLGAFEVVYVNDGSTDATARQIMELRPARPWLRCVSHAQSCGQSAAVRTGVQAARAAIVVTLDGDGQNDPVFIPKLLEALEAAGEGTGLAAGQRVGRKATGFKKFQSRVANGVRGFVLKDGTRDTGCGLKAFRREAFLSLPYFDAIHRFLPASFWSTSSTASAASASRITASSTACGSASSISWACGGSSDAGGACPPSRR
jgi:dolichol-phosphate mannosyltransferase